MRPLWHVAARAIAKCVCSRPTGTCLARPSRGPPPLHRATRDPAALYAHSGRPRSRRLLGSRAFSSCAPSRRARSVRTFSRALHFTVYERGTALADGGRTGTANGGGLDRTSDTVLLPSGVIGRDVAGGFRRGERGSRRHVSRRSGAAPPRFLLAGNPARTSAPLRATQGRTPDSVRVHRCVVARVQSACHGAHCVTDQLPRVHSDACPDGDLGTRDR
jgi:hypothetical protein